jgi:hypothetical protein
MKLNVAFNEQGKILAAAEEGADQPAEMPGVTVAELDVPREFEGREALEFMHLLRVDVRGRKLTRGASSND